MKKFPSQYFLLACILSVALGACVSSEETGGASDPIPAPTKPVPAARDTHLTQSKALSKTSADPIKRPVSSQSRVSPKIKSRQDTVQTSLVKKSKPAARPSTIEVERPDNAMYTIQIGAFLQAPNALRNVKKTKERFPGQPVYNRFHKVSGFYRVSVGRFGEAKDAWAFRKEMLKKNPKEYATCWVNYIAR